MTGVEVIPISGGDLRAAVIVACSFASAEDGGLPELNASVGVEGVDAVVFSSDIKDVVKLVADNNVGEEQRLGIDFTVNRIETNLAELSGVDVALGEDRFFCVQAIAGYVVVESGYVGRIGRHSGLDGERERRRVREGSDVPLKVTFADAEGAVSAAVSVVL